MKKTRRTAQLGEVLRAEISNVITRELRDPDVGWATVMEVEVATDMKFARVHVSVLGDEETQERTITALDKSRAKIRHLVAQRVRLRYMPDLEFRLDRTAERAARIEGILKDVVPLAAPEEDEEQEQGDDGNDREE
ncbi:MAG: 30S ribosome-binding factor RbfA [Thermoanaerobaculia bacterium]